MASWVDVIGFGALNMDLLLYVDRIPREEEEVFVRRVEEEPGGSAANTIVALSRLGVKTAYIGRVGSDEAGRRLLDNMREEGVDTSMISIGDGRSGRTIILVDERGNRAIVVDPGENDMISPDSIDLDLIERARLVHMTSFVCLKSDLSYRAQLRILRETDVDVSFDPGYIYASRGMRYIEEFLKRSRIILLNEIELREITGLEDPRDGARILLDLGAEIVVVKLGERGCFATNGKLEVEVPSVMPERIVDTTGAGDAFNAGFILGFLRGYDLRRCCQLGNYVASRCIAERGARRGLPRIEEIPRELLSEPTR